jgi:sec-independent protein translocase protein TatB
MFDIGFSEIMVIAVVALVVLGPEKLPRTARTLGHLFGRLQRYVADVKADINRELELDELRKLQTEVKSAAREIETSMASATQEVQANVRALESELNAAAGAASTPAAAAPAAAIGAAPAQPSAESNVASGVGAAAPPRESPRQETLPGFERP